MMSLLADFNIQNSLRTMVNEWWIFMIIHISNIIESFNFVHVIISVECGVWICYILKLSSYYYFNDWFVK